MHSTDAIQLRLQHCRPRRINGSFIHAGGVIVADLLFDRILLRRGCRRFFQNFAQQHSVVIRELGREAPARLVGWNGILLEPASARVREKVRARIHAGVHGIDIEDGLVPRRGAL